MTEQWRPAPVKKIKQAAAELKGLIRTRYPDAEFRLVKAGNDRYIWHLWTTVDIEDPEEVNDLVRDRELDMQDEEHIPLYVIPMASERVHRHLPNGANGKQA
jgi:hypothetical protein